MSAIKQPDFYIGVTRDPPAIVSIGKTIDGMEVIDVVELNSELTEDKKRGFEKDINKISEIPPIKPLMPTNQAAQAEPETETEAEAQAEAEAETEPDAQAQAQAQADAEAETEPDAQADAEAETDAVAQAETKTDAVAQAQTETETETEAKTAVDAISVFPNIKEQLPASVVEPEPKLKADADAQAKIDAATIEDDGDSLVDLLNNNSSFGLPPSPAVVEKKDGVTGDGRGGGKKTKRNKNKNKRRRTKRRKTKRSKK